MKQVPYRTVYVEFPDVYRVVKEAGIPPSRFQEDGSPFYTVPSIIDDSTGAAVTDSYKIAEYLDKAYPNTPKAFPPGTEALQAAFYRLFSEKIRVAFTLLVPEIPRILDEKSLDFYYSTREATYGKPVDRIRPVGEELEKTWAQVGEVFDMLDEWYGKSSGKFLVGNEASFGDFTVGALVGAVRTVGGEKGEDWKRLKALNNGRWAKLLSDLEKYASVEN